ncbi:SDR family oxidoreductase [Rhodosalinus sp.]|uniref:SDR family oxidoreductase n=1 Tax=Rhodosalinus sp. TaxID=2047741 RepID=UPI00397D39F0
MRVNAMGPAAVDTAFLCGGTGRSDEDAHTARDVEARARMTPLGRRAQPADVVGPILILLGPESAFMPGQLLWVNGGGYMQ